MHPCRPSRLWITSTSYDTDTSGTEPVTCPCGPTTYVRPGVELPAGYSVLIMMNTSRPFTRSDITREAMRTSSATIFSLPSPCHCTEMGPDWSGKIDAQKCGNPNRKISELQRLERRYFDPSFVILFLLSPLCLASS